MAATRLTEARVSPTPITGAPPLADPLSLPHPALQQRLHLQQHLQHQQRQQIYLRRYLLRRHSAQRRFAESQPRNLHPGWHRFAGKQRESFPGTGVTLYHRAGRQSSSMAPTTLIWWPPRPEATQGSSSIRVPLTPAPHKSTAAPARLSRVRSTSPDSPIQLNGSNTAAYTIVVSKSVQINGSSFNIGSDYSSLPGGSPVKSTTGILVE